MLWEPVDCVVFKGVLWFWRSLASWECSLSIQIWTSEFWSKCVCFKVKLHDTQFLPTEWLCTCGGGVGHLYLTTWERGAVHMENALLCKRTFCIILADRPHASCERTFLKPGLWVEKSENAGLAVSCGQLIRILSVSMTPSTSSPRPLNAATSHNNNNISGGLHPCVRAAEVIEPFLQLTCIVVECE